MATQVQAGLFDAPPPQSRRLSSQEAFELFHHRNPQVYRLICEHARDLKRRGFATYSMKTIWCVMRFHSDVGRDFAEHWKLNDRYYSRYARLVMANEPDLKDFFTTRELRTK